MHESNDTTVIIVQVNVAMMKSEILCKPPTTIYMVYLVLHRLERGE